MVSRNPDHNPRLLINKLAHYWLFITCIIRCKEYGEIFYKKVWSSGLSLTERIAIVLWWSVIVPNDFRLRQVYCVLDFISFERFYIKKCQAIPHMCYIHHTKILNYTTEIQTYWGNKNINYLKINWRYITMIFQ